MGSHVGTMLFRNGASHHAEAFSVQPQRGPWMTSSMFIGSATAKAAMSGISTNAAGAHRAAMAPLSQGRPRRQKQPRLSFRHLEPSFTKGRKHASGAFVNASVQGLLCHGSGHHQHGQEEREMFHELN